MRIDTTARVLANEASAKNAYGTGAAQEQRLRDLIRHAASHSPYHGEHLRGLQDAPLHDLPTLSKAQLMDHWDSIVCDPRLKRRDLEHYVRQPVGPGLYLGQYRVLSTSGTSRREAILAYSRREWTGVLAGLSRGLRWLRQVRNDGCYVMIGAGADNRISMSQELCRSIAAFRPNAHFVDCREPIELLVKKINSLQPDSLSGYASILGMLADEQLAGRLRIAPRTINSSAEVCTPALKSRMVEAFGVAVDETYTIGEAGVIAATCHRQQGMHVMTDDVVLECINAHGALVAPGNVGHQLLVTVLRSRTLPLIRYVIPDRVRFAVQPCGCGLPGPVIEAVEGRVGEILELPGREREEIVRLSVWEFDRDLQALGIHLWQIGARKEAITLYMSPHQLNCDVEFARLRAEELIRRAGSYVSVRVEINQRLAPGVAGKLDRLVYERGET